MGYDEVLSTAEEVLKEQIPEKSKITKIMLEGPILCVYTSSIELLASSPDLVKQLAQRLRRRVSIRPDPSLLTPAKEAEEKIKEIIPEEARISGMFFDEEQGEVSIEVFSPAHAMGKEGELLNEIKKKVGWIPKVVRSPPIPSKVIEETRELLRTVASERREFLIQLGKKICREGRGGEQFVRITALGGFREVGRSCALLTTNESKVLVDCGMAMESEDIKLPYLKAPEVLPLEQLDAIVITHAHLDHCGLLPALYKYGYDGPTYCTPPTRDLMALLLLDNIKVSHNEGKKLPFESKHIREMVKRCITLRYGETTDISPDIRLTFQNAGHILGSAIVHFHIGDGFYNIAFTGDMKFERSWLFNAAINKFPRLETLLIESTYGGYHDIQPSRQDASDALQQIISQVLERNGKVIIPVFAVGRSQEVMLVLESAIRNGKIPPVPVYLDGMIWEATAIHTAYPEFLNSHLRTQIFQMDQSPFLSDIFKRVDSYDKRQEILDSSEPCVMLATSGMMNGGPVLEYVKVWGPDPNNALVFVGYQAEGTMGRKIQRGLRELIIVEKGNPTKIPLNLEVTTCDGFSGHSDRMQLINYLFSLDPRPEKVIVMHGEENKCRELASVLHKKFRMETMSPQNLETVRVK